MRYLTTEEILFFDNWLWDDRDIFGPKWAAVADEILSLPIPERDEPEPVSGTIMDAR